TSSSAAAAARIHRVAIREVSVMPNSRVFVVVEMALMLPQHARIGNDGARRRGGTPTELLAAARVPPGPVTRIVGRPVGECRLEPSACVGDVIHLARHRRYRE